MQHCFNEIMIAESAQNQHNPVPKRGRDISPDGCRIEEVLFLSADWLQKLFHNRAAGIKK